MVGIPNGLVTSQHAFIMGIGPMATTSRTSFSVRENVGQRVGDESLAAVTAVVGGDDQLIAEFAEPVFPKHQVPVAEPHDRDGAVARVLVLAQLRIDRRHAQSAAHQHHGAVQFPYVARQAKRSDEVENAVAFPEGHHLEGGLAHRLDHHRNRAPAGIEIGHGERNPFAILVHASHDEVSRTRRSRQIRGAHFPQESRRSKLLPSCDAIHQCTSRRLVSGSRFNSFSEHADQVLCRFINAHPSLLDHPHCPDRRVHTRTPISDPEVFTLLLTIISRREPSVLARGVGWFCRVRKIRSWHNGARIG